MPVPAGFCSIPLSPTQLCLDVVLRCGQSFLWHIFPLPEAGTAGPTHEYRLCLPDRVVCLRQSSDALHYRALFPPSVADDGKTEAWLRDYFQLDVDLDALYTGWKAKDKIFESVAGRFGGIRMLRQDPWECLMSFICSQNNHISRITKMVQSLPNAFSPPLLSHVHPTDASSLLDYRPFPPPQALAAPEIEPKLRELGFGYRAKYIQATAAKLCKESSDPLTLLKSLRLLDLSEARAKLLALDGVGPKVADCVLLMSLDKTEVVPVDTHVYQIAVKHYGLKGPKGKPASMTPKLYTEIGQKFIAEWGPYAGWAQSVLFTADLKSFAQYDASASSTAASSLSTPSDLPSPPPTPGSSVKTAVVEVNISSVAATPAKRRRATMPLTPDSLPRTTKRSRLSQSDPADEDGESDLAETVSVQSSLETIVEGGHSMSDRIKLRRRTTVRRVPR